MIEKHFNYISKPISHCILTSYNLPQQQCVTGWCSSPEDWGFIWDEAFREELNSFRGISGTPRQVSPAQEKQGEASEFSISAAWPLVAAKPGAGFRAHLYYLVVACFIDTPNRSRKKDVLAVRGEPTIGRLGSSLLG